MAAKSVASDLRKAFARRVKVGLMAAESSSSWPVETSWDDLLVVVYKDENFPNRGNSFITQYFDER
jgi:hypothetical protein